MKTLLQWTTILLTVFAVSYGIAYYLVRDHMKDIDEQIDVIYSGESVESLGRKLNEKVEFLQNLGFTDNMSNAIIDSVDSAEFTVDNDNTLFIKRIDYVDKVYNLNFNKEVLINKEVRWLIIGMNTLFDLQEYCKANNITEITPEMAIRVACGDLSEPNTVCNNNIALDAINIYNKTYR